MNRFSLFVVATVAASHLAACTTTKYGNSNVTDVGKFMTLQKGVSTKSDIYTTFGQPHDVEYAPSNTMSVWRYYTVQMRSNGLELVPVIGLFAAGQNTDTRTTDILFDAKDRFQGVNTDQKVQFVQNWYGIAESITRTATDNKHTRVQQEMLKLGKPFDKKIAAQVSTE